MAKGKSFLFGVLVGGVVGAGATLLSVPATGKNFRSIIKERLTEWKQLAATLKDDGEQLKNQLAKTSREGALLVKQLTEEMKTSVEDWKETVEPHQENINEYLEQIEMSLKNLEDKVKNQKD